MKTKFLMFILLSVFSNSVFGQKVNFQGGQIMLGVQTYNLELIGTYDDHVYYIKSIIAESGLKHYLVKLNRNSLAIIREFNLSFAGYPKFWEYSGLFGNKLVLIYLNVSQNGDEFNFDYKGLVFDLDKGFDDYKAVNFATIIQNSLPVWSCEKSEETYHLHSDAYVKYYDKSLDQINIEENEPAIIHTELDSIIRTKGMEMPEANEARNSKRKYFYPLKFNSGFFIESYFLPDNNCYSKSATKGYFTDIRIALYDTVYNECIKSYDVEIDLEKYLINYDCHYMPDKSFVIIGVFQDASFHYNSSKLGIFSVILDSNLNEISGIKYTVPVEILEDDIHYNFEAGRYLYSDQPVMYERLDLGNDKHCFFKIAYKSEGNHSEFDIIRINKKTGDIKIDRLFNKVSAAYHLGFKDYLVYNLSDTSLIIFFNDHPKNEGLGPDQAHLKLNKATKKTSGFSFIIYNCSSGFTSRKVLISAADEGFMLYNYKGSIVELKNGDGSTSIILYSSDRLSENHRFYKVTFSN